MCEREKEREQDVAVRGRAAEPKQFSTRSSSDLAVKGQAANGGPGQPWSPRSHASWLCVIRPALRNCSRDMHNHGPAITRFLEHAHPLPATTCLPAPSSVLMSTPHAVSCPYRAHAASWRRAGGPWECGEEGSS